jgi:hypothetical protein
MGRSYERKELFGGDQIGGTRTHSAVVVREAVGDRVKAGSRYALGEIELPFWTPQGARVIATFEDGSAAITLNKFGQGLVVTIVPDAWTAAHHMPELMRETIGRAMSSIGAAPLVDIVGTNEKTDMAVGRTPKGFRVAVINHNSGELEVMLRPLKTLVVRLSGWVDLVSGDKLETSTVNRSIKVKIPGRGFRALEFRRTSVD